MDLVVDDVDGDGVVYFDLNGVLDIQPGFEIEVEDVYTLKRHTVTSLVVDVIDPITDTASGTAGNNAQIDTWIHGEDVDLTTMSDGSGNWAFDYTGHWDLVAGDGVGFSEMDADGDRTQVDWMVALPDVLAPVVVVGGPGDGEVVSAVPVVLSGSVSDDVGVVRVRITVRDLDSLEFWDGSGWQVGWVSVDAVLAVPGGFDTGWSYSFDPPDPLSGSGYKWTVMAVDAAGNWSDLTTHPFTVGDDVLAPVVVVGGPGDGEVVSAVPVVLSGSVSDDVGVVRVRITVRDRDSLEFWDGSGWQVGWVSVDAVLAVPGGVDTGWSYSFDPPDPLSASGYKWTVMAVDAAGNWSDLTTHPFTVGDDVLAPVVVVGGPGDGEVVPAVPVVLSGSVSDDVGVVRVRITVRDLDSLEFWDGSGWQVGWVSVDAVLAVPGGVDTGWSYSFDPPDPLSASGYKWTVMAVDAAGNWSDLTTHPFTVGDDVLAPVVVVGGPGDGEVVPAVPVVLSGSVSDDVGVVRVRITVRDRDSLEFWDGSGWQVGWVSVDAVLAVPGGVDTGWSYSFDPPDPLSASGYKWTVMAVDAAGNWSDLTTHPFTVGDDVLAPVVVVGGPGDGEVVPAVPVVLSGSVSDDVGVVRVRITVRDLDSLEFWDGSGWQVGWVSVDAVLAVPGGVDTGWSYSFDPPDPLSASGYKWTVMAVDAAGNWSDLTTHPFTIDVGT